MESIIQYGYWFLGFPVFNFCTNVEQMMIKFLFSQIILRNYSSIIPFISNCNLILFIKLTIQYIKLLPRQMLKTITIFPQKLTWTIPSSHWLTVRGRPRLIAYISAPVNHRCAQRNIQKTETSQNIIARNLLRFLVLFMQLAFLCGS